MSEGGRRVHGTTNLYGYRVGILVIEGHFPRLPGAIGNASTFPFPVLHKIVPGATGKRTVRDMADLDPHDPKYRAAVDPWIEGARELEREGVRAVTTSCGFAALFQEEMTRAVDVPVFATSLLLVPLVHRTLKPGRKVGVLTADSRMLRHRHLHGAGISPEQVVVRGLEASPVFEAMAYHDEHELDVDALEAEIVAAASSLSESKEEVGAVLLECSLFPPFATAVQQATGLAVFDFTHLVTLMHSAMNRRPFDGIL